MEVVLSLQIWGPQVGLSKDLSLVLLRLSSRSTYGEFLFPISEKWTQMWYGVSQPVISSESLVAEDK